MDKAEAIFKAGQLATYERPSRRLFYDGNEIKEERCTSFFTAEERRQLAFGDEDTNFWLLQAYEDRRHDWLQEGLNSLLNMPGGVK